MLTIELRSGSARVEIAGHGSGSYLRYTYFGSAPQVAFVEELVQDAFGERSPQPTELLSFLNANEWVQKVFGAPELIQGSLDTTAHNPDKAFEKLELGQKLVVSGLLSQDELDALLQEYIPFSGSQRFGEFLKLKMCLPHKVIDFMLGLSTEDLQQFNNKRLGERLIAMGLIDEDSLKQATAKQASMASRPRIGDVLVSMGAIKPEQADFFSKLMVSEDGNLQASQGA